MIAGSRQASEQSSHPRSLGWLGTTALALGGSNQSLFLVGALIVSQGSGAVPLLVVGLLLSWAAVPGWTELVLMWPDRVGGISAACAEAFRPYSAVLANLAGTCYWWGWVPTCGLTAILSASALHQWYLPGIAVTPLAATIVVIFACVNLAGVRWATRVALPIACGSAALALLATLIPVISGSVDWQAAGSFHLVTPFGGFFGGLTSAMAGLYLIGFAAPAFEAAACHVGEMRNPARNVPRAMFASAGMATIYFVALPVVLLGVIGTDGLGGDLSATLGPTFEPLFGSLARSAAIWFMVLNMFHGTLQPLAGASRTLSQLSEDGLLPRVLARRSRTDAPWVATLLTAAVSIAFLTAGDPTWMIAAANFTYLIGIGLPSVAVWLLRRNSPGQERPFRAPRGTIMLGVGAAACWAVATVLGFSQFGLPTVLFGLALAYSGSVFYAWRTWSDRRRCGEPTTLRSLHVKLTGAMLLVIALDGAGYLLAVTTVDSQDAELVVLLKDIFVLVAMLTISVGLVLPGMIAHAVGQVASAARRLADGTLAELTTAMEALAAGRLQDAHARSDAEPLDVRSTDEVGAMAKSFNVMQDQVTRAASALDGARESLRRDRDRREAVEVLLERQRQQLLEAQAVGGVGSWEWDVATDVVQWSDELCRIHGLEPGCHPRSLREVAQSMHPDDRARWQAQLRACLESGEPLVSERRIVRPDGSVRVIATRGEVVSDGDGNAERMVGIGQDITERHELERAKDEFTSVVSHELRTPLTSIRGSLGLLESGVLGELPDEGQRMVEIAVQNTDRLVRLINDILDIERINAGEIDMHPTSCDSDELIARAMESVGSIVTAAGVSVVTNAERVRLWADADRVIQTLTNLVGNAVKFSPAGSSVHVSCSRRGEEVLFEVADEGRGIPAEKLESIFRRFGQVDASDSRQYGGTGLGLAICRSIVEQHGGRIWAHSLPGAGATFSFLLPAPSAYDSLVSHAPDAHAATVLVCDDDPGAVEIMQGVLERRGYQVIAAGCGEQAIEYAVARHPDAILLDLLMPGMSAWETAAALTALPETADIPTMILSVMAPDENDSLAGAIVDRVHKPLDDVQVLEALDRATSSRDEPFTVLVVEDDRDLASPLATMFDRRGMQTYRAATGARAIEISGLVLPDLLVLDLGLPEAAGFEVVEWLHGHDRLHAVPVALYAARDLDETERQRSRRESTPEFLISGRISPADFDARVVALLQRRMRHHVREDTDERQAHAVGR